MEFDLTTTAAGFVLLVLIGVGVSWVMMPPRIVLMMVLPSLVVYALLTLVLGVKHGEYRARGSR